MGGARLRSTATAVAECEGSDAGAGAGAGLDAGGRSVLLAVRVPMRGGVMASLCGVGNGSAAAGVRGDMDIWLFEGELGVDGRQDADVELRRAELEMEIDDDAELLLDTLDIEDKEMSRIGRAGRARMSGRVSGTGYELLSAYVAGGETKDASFKGRKSFVRSAVADVYCDDEYALVGEREGDSRYYETPRPCNVLHGGNPE